MARMIPRTANPGRWQSLVSRHPASVYFVVTVAGMVMAACLITEATTALPLLAAALHSRPASRALSSSLPRENLPA